MKVTPRLFSHSTLAEFTGIVAAITSECWPFSQRNGGCFPDGMLAVFARITHHIASMEDYLASMWRGATNQTELSKDVVSELPFLRPPHLLSEQFESIAKDTTDQVRNLTQQIIMLTKARDLLLPRLMNGDIVV